MQQALPLQPVQPQRVNGMGTGIVLDGRGYILTNFHVVDKADGVTVTLHHLISHTSGLPDPRGTTSFKSVAWKRPIAPSEQVGWAQTLPQIPRLVHQSLSHSATGSSSELLRHISELQQSQRRMRQGLWVITGLLVALLAVAGVGLSQSIVLVY